MLCRASERNQALLQRRKPRDVLYAFKCKVITPHSEKMKFSSVLLPDATYQQLFVARQTEIGRRSGGSRKSHISLL